jgi:hypothetical protein
LGKMKKIIVGLLFLLYSLTALAGLTDDWWVVATVHSFHTNRTAGYNENNFGIGLEKKLTENLTFGFGEYRNSIWNNSTYIGFMYTPFHLWGLKAGAMMGLINGYSSDVNAYSPLLIPALVYEKNKWGINAIFVPPITSVDSGVVGFQVKYKW